MLSISLPTSWGELSDKQKYNYVLDRTTESHEYACIMLAFSIAPSLKRKLVEYDDELQIGIIYKTIVSTFDYLLTPPLEATILRTKVNRRWYYMPKPKLEHSTYREFMLADRYYSAMMQEDADQEYEARRLFFTLCRPLLDRINPDPRVGVPHEHHIKTMAQSHIAIPAHVLLSVVMYFSATKEYIYEQYGKWLFPSGSDSGIRPDVNFGWYGMAMTVADSGAIGNSLDDVLDADFHKVCAYMIKKISEAKAQAAAMETN